jgi:hypothetical protein
MPEMIKVTCPVCSAHVAHDGRAIRGQSAEFSKCVHDNIRECIELWRIWKRAETEVHLRKVADFDVTRG